MLEPESNPEPTLSVSYFCSQVLELRERWSLLSFWEKESIVPLSLKALGYVYASRDNKRKRTFLRRHSLAVYSYGDSTPLGAYVNASGET